MADKLVDNLLLRLEHPDEGVRREAVDSLECHPCIQSFEALVWAASKSRDAQLRRRASDTAERVARSLWQQFTELLPRLQKKELEPNEAVAAAIEGPDEGLCEAGIVAAALLKNREVIPALRQVLSGPANSPLKAITLQALGYLGGKDEVPILAEWSLKGDEETARAAVIGLAMMRKARSYAALCPLLGQENRSVANLALRYLRRLPVGQLEKLLANMLGADRRGNVGWAIETCRLLVPPHWRELLRPLLSSHNGFIKSKAQEAFDYLQNRTTEPAVEKKPAETSFEWIAKAVEESDHQKVSLIVERLKNDEDVRLRAMYLSALGSLGRESHVDLVLSYFKDSDDRVRANAIEAAGLLKIHLSRQEWMDKVVDHLIDALSDGTNRVRANAALALIPQREDAVLWALEDLVYCGKEAGQKSAMYVIESAGSDKFQSLVKFLAQKGIPAVRQRAQNLCKGLKRSSEDVAATLAQVLGSELRESFGGE